MRDCTLIISLLYTIRISISHLKIISGFCLAVMLAVGPPVGRYHSLKVPLTAQNTGQKILVLRCLNAVDQVVWTT